MKAKLFSVAALCLLALSATLFTACDKEDSDVTKPVIKLKEPEKGDSLLIGDPHGVHLEMDLSDNVMLKSYKIDVHNNFDGHSHTKSGDGTKPFSFAKEYDLSGKREAHIHHHDIKIPKDATPGKYHLMIYCTDAAGNESHVACDVVLSTTAKPHDHHGHDHH
jgi:hypothetical protein